MSRFSSSESMLLPLLASAPLLVAVDYAISGLIFSILTVLALVSTALLVNLLHGWVAVHLRFLLLLLVAAAVASMMNLLLSVFAWGLYQEIYRVIPFFFFNSFLFLCLEKDTYSCSLIQALRRVCMHIPVLVFIFFIFGCIRELLLHGSIGAWCNPFALVFSPAGGVLQVDILPVLFFARPAGIFFLLAGMAVLLRLLPYRGKSESNVSQED